MSKTVGASPFLKLFAAFAVALGVVVALADTTRAPDASATSAAAALNTTIGDSDLSPEGGLNTLPLSFFLFVR